MELTTKHIMITGSDGFLGQNVVAESLQKQAAHIFIPRHCDFDLTQMVDVIRILEDGKSDVIIHLNAKVGDIGINRENPGEFFYDNLMMGAQSMEQARRFGFEAVSDIILVVAKRQNLPIPCCEL